MPEFPAEKEWGDSGWVLVPGHPTILSGWIWISQCLDRSPAESEQQGYGRGMCCGLLTAAHPWQKSLPVVLQLNILVAHQMCFLFM